MRKWISNDTALMAQWAAEGFDTHPMDGIHQLGTKQNKTAYVKVRKQNEVLVNLITSKTRVAPPESSYFARLELLGALVAARLSSRVREIVRKKRSAKCSTGHSKIASYSGSALKMETIRG
ncbi:hypothetical protein TNCV_206981 [Trichonephila clavipes]|nr:hypothetical protein TNCV_206981 [Trichonephila clavipes]